MMKIFLNIVLFVFLISKAYSQVTPDSTRTTRDTTVSVPTEKIPVFSDTTQYNDTSVIQSKSGKDSVVVKKKVHSPRKATMRSLIIPGWGQVYNKKYWKVPIVYGAIGVPAYLITYNRKWYNKTKYALSMIANNRYGTPGAADSLNNVDPKLRVFVEQKDLGPLVDYRNAVRRDLDYALLFTILMWGLNVVDATVDGHLKGFDVSDELTVKIRPTIVPNTMIPGVAVAVSFK